MDKVYDELMSVCRNIPQVCMQLGAIYFCSQRGNGPLSSFFEKDMPEVAHIIHRFVKFANLKNLNDATEKNLADFKKCVMSGAMPDIKANLIYVVRDVLRCQLEINRADGIALPQIERFEPIPPHNNYIPSKTSDDEDRYGLKKVTSPKNPIYRQLFVFYDYCEQVLAYTSKTMDGKTHSVNDFIRFSGLTRLEDITNQQIYDWVKYHKERGNTARSVNNYLHQLKAMLKWQRDENVKMPNLKISRISFQKEAPARKNWFTRRQIKLALLYADPREWLMISLSFDCGLRIEELMNLKLSDINRRKVKIIGKGNRLRWGMMSRKTRRHLKKWIKKERITDYLWRGRNNVGHLGQEKARQLMQDVFAKAGFDNMVPHDLRHSFATELKLLGLPTRKIQLALGHTSEAITEHYLSDLDGVTIENIRKEVSFALFRLRIHAFFANLFYILPRITLKPAN